MQNLSLQDILTILGPILTLMGIMWRHSNEQFKEMNKKLTNDMKEMEGKLTKEMKEMKEEMKEMKGEMQELKMEMKEMEIRSNNEVKEVKIEMKEMEIGMRGMESRLTNKIEDTYKSLTKQVTTDRERISHIEGQLEPTPIIRLPIKETPKKSLRTQRQAVSA